MAWGGGNAIAHRAVDAVMGPRTIRHETVASTAPAADSTAMAASSNPGGSDTCGVRIKAFQDVSSAVTVFVRDSFDVNLAPFCFHNGKKICELSMFISSSVMIIPLRLIFVFQPVYA